MFKAITVISTFFFFAYNGYASEISVDEKVALSSDYQTVKHSSNENGLSSVSPNAIIRADFPTRIIRLEADIASAGVNCGEVIANFETIFSKKITSDSFIYNTLLGCSTDINSGLATKFVVDSYFDPLSNSAEIYLQSYLHEFEGYDFYGTPLHFEEAKGVTVALEINAGQEDSRADHHILRLARDYRTLWFKNNYDLSMRFINDLKERFFSQDRNKILPFIAEWFYPVLAELYENTLAIANMVELYPEKIFLMEKAPYVFTPRLHFYYKHHCSRYKNRKCLI